MWRDREQTLTERAQALETYINDVLLTGSHEKVVQVADFLDLDFLELASFFLSRADSDEDGNVAQRVSILSRIVGALSLAVALAAGTCWIVMLALWVVARDAAMHAASAAQRLLTSLAPSSVPLPEVSLPLSSLPPPFRHLVAVSASTLRGNTTLADCKAQWATTLAGPAADLYLRLDSRLTCATRGRGDTAALAARLPARPKELCQRSLQAVWPEVITAVHARAAYPKVTDGAAMLDEGSVPPSPSFDPAVLVKAPPSSPPEDDAATTAGTSSCSSVSASPTGDTFSLLSLALGGAAAAAVCRRRLPRRARAEPEGRLFAREAQPVRRETRGAERTRAQRRSERGRAAAGRG